MFATRLHSVIQFSQAPFQKKKTFTGGTPHKEMIFKRVRKNNNNDKNKSVAINIK